MRRRRILLVLNPSVILGSKHPHFPGEDNTEYNTEYNTLSSYRVLYISRSTYVHVRIHGQIRFRTGRSADPGGYSAPAGVIFRPAPHPNSAHGPQPRMRSHAAPRACGSARTHLQPAVQAPVRSQVRSQAGGCAHVFHSHCPSACHCDMAPTPTRGTQARARAQYLPIHLLLPGC